MVSRAPKCRWKVEVCLTALAARIGVSLDALLAMGALDVQRRLAA